MSSDNGKKSVIKDISLSLLEEGKTIRIKAHGYSMYPSVKPGSLLLIEPLQRGGHLITGEIVAIKRDSGIIVHRLIKIVKKGDVTYYITRGDSNPLADDPVKIERIAGRVVRSETTGENTIAADIKVNTSPNYFRNRLRVIILHLWKKINC